MHFEKHLDFKSIHEFFSLKTKVDFNLDLKKTLLTHFKQPRFQGNLNFSQVNNIHNVSPTSSEEDVNIYIYIIYIYIILSNDSLKRFSCRATEVLHYEQLRQKFPQGIRPSPRL